MNRELLFAGLLLLSLLYNAALIYQVERWKRLATRALDVAEQCQAIQAPPPAPGAELTSTSVCIAEFRP